MKRLQILLLSMLALSILSGCFSSPKETHAAVTPPPVQTAPVPSPVPAEDLALPEPSTEEPQPDEDPQTVTYILNTNTKKFHRPSCRSAKQIKPGNRQETGDAREDLLAQGYSPCGNCKP